MVPQPLFSYSPSYSPANATLDSDGIFQIFTSMMSPSRRFFIITDDVREHKFSTKCRLFSHSNTKTYCPRRAPLLVPGVRFRLNIGNENRRDI